MRSCLAPVQCCQACSPHAVMTHLGNCDAVRAYPPALCWPCRPVGLPVRAVPGLAPLQAMGQARTCVEHTHMLDPHALDSLWPQQSTPSVTLEEMDTQGHTRTTHTPNAHARCPPQSGQPVLLFLGSPRLSTLEEMDTHGLYLADIPLHDMSRDFVMLAEQRQVRAGAAVGKRWGIGGRWQGLGGAPPLGSVMPCWQSRAGRGAVESWWAAAGLAWGRPLGQCCVAA